MRPKQAAGQLYNPIAPGMQTHSCNRVHIHNGHPHWDQSRLVHRNRHAPKINSYLQFLNTPLHGSPCIGRAAALLNNDFDERRHFKSGRTSAFEGHPEEYLVKRDTPRGSAGCSPLRPSTNIDSMYGTVMADPQRSQITRGHS